MSVKVNISWRTAPRSIQVLINWLPYFYQHQGESWDLKLNPQLRRKIRWTYENDKEVPDDEVVGVPYKDFITGKQKGSRDKESLVRQVCTTAEQFGFLGVRGENKGLFITEAGKRIIENTFTPEDFLVQLIKMYVITNKDEEGIFPFEIFIKLINEFNYLSRFELAYMFAVTTPQKYKIALEAINEFRTQYNDRSIINNKNDNKKVELIHKNIWEKYFDKGTYLKSWEDYTDAFLRAVSYTDFFITSGRGKYTKVRVKDLFKKKFDLLVSEKFKFKKPPKKEVETKGNITYSEVSSRDDLEWYGAIGNITLPWDNFIERKKLVENSFMRVREEFENYESNILNKEEIKELSDEIKTTKSITRLKDIENDLSNKLMIRNQEHFVEVVSKTKEAKKEIIERFDIILNDNDMSALWLEVNTWKSLVSINGEKKVVPNFKMEEDLTPRAFAPGLNNTPDMELYTKEFTIVPEVSLMTGKVQWEHEASSVIDHVNQIKKNNKNNTLGLFISSTINQRTLWQYFILSKTSWLGKPIPVIPLTIKQYTEIIKNIYDNERDINDFYNLLNVCATASINVDDYIEWQTKINENIETFVN